MRDEHRTNSTARNHKNNIVQFRNIAAEHNVPNVSMSKTTYKSASSSIEVTNDAQDQDNWVCIDL